MVSTLWMVVLLIPYQTWHGAKHFNYLCILQLIVGKINTTVTEMEEVTILCCIIYNFEILIFVSVEVNYSVNFHGLQNSTPQKLICIDSIQYEQSHGISLNAGDLFGDILCW